MSQYESFIKCVKENYNIITQMMMFEEKTLDNPIYKFLVANMKNSSSILNDQPLPIFNNEKKEFFEDILKRSIELSHLAGEVISGNVPLNILLKKIEEYIPLNQDWIINYKIYLV